MTQETRIINHLKANQTLTRLEAVTELNIFELAARINGLEGRGYTFNKVKAKGIDRYNEKFIYTVYSLEGLPHGQ